MTQHGNELELSIEMGRRDKVWAEVRTKSASNLEGASHWDDKLLIPVQGDAPALASHPEINTLLRATVHFEVVSRTSSGGVVMVR